MPPALIVLHAVISCSQVVGTATLNFSKSFLL